MHVEFSILAITIIYCIWLEKITIIELFKRVQKNLTLKTYLGI